jgi:hypothetical protein
MEVYTTEFLDFRQIGDTGKTKIWRITTKGNEHSWLGEIRWFGAWRKYCFYPDGGTIFDNKCMLEIINFISDRMAERKNM